MIIKSAKDLQISTFSLVSELSQFAVLSKVAMENGLFITFMHKDYKVIDVNNTNKNGLILVQLFKMWSTIVLENDPFVDVFSELVSSNTKSFCLKGGLGQFFTPPEIADALSKIVNIEEELENEYIKIADPCGCGAGSLLLGSLRNANIFKRKDKNFIVYGVDIDYYVMIIANAQILMNLTLFDVDNVSVRFECKDIIKEYSKDRSITTSIPYAEILKSQICK